MTYTRAVRVPPLDKIRSGAEFSYDIVVTKLVGRNFNLPSLSKEYAAGDKKNQQIHAILQGY